MSRNSCHCCRPSSRWPMRSSSRTAISASVLRKLPSTRRTPCARAAARPSSASARPVSTSPRSQWAEAIRFWARSSSSTSPARPAHPVPARGIHLGREVAEAHRVGAAPLCRIGAQLGRRRPAPRALPGLRRRPAARCGVPACRALARAPTAGETEAAVNPARHRRRSAPARVPRGRPRSHWRSDCAGVLGGAGEEVGGASACRRPPRSAARPGRGSRWHALRSSRRAKPRRGRGTCAAGA